MYALARQLGRMFEEGLNNRYARHRAMAEKVRGWAEENLGLFASADFRSDTLTTVTNTKQIDFAELSAGLRKEGMAIANGYGELKNQTFRIAHMGDIPGDALDRLLTVFSAILQR